jgi:hypothetical protein
MVAGAGRGRSVLRIECSGSRRRWPEAVASRRPYRTGTARLLRGRRNKCATCDPKATSANRNAPARAGKSRNSQLSGVLNPWRVPRDIWPEAASNVPGV